MSALIIKLTEKEFRDRFILSAKETRANFNNRKFIKSTAFSTKMRDKAIRYCQENADSKTKFLLVESPYFTTIWIEDKNTQNSSIEKPENSYSSLAQDVQKTAKSIQKQLATKKVFRKYRGQTYEVEVPNLLLIQDPTKDRKYRGKSY